MKTSKMKSVMIATLMVLIAVIGSTPVQAGTNGAPVLTYEKNAIAKDVTKVTTTKDHVVALQSQLKTERKAGHNTVAIEKNLKKAKADYVQAQVYLQADKEDLAMDHQTYVKERKAIVRKDQNKLVRTTFTPADNRQCAIAVSKQQLKTDQQELKQAKITRNEDLLAVNKKISDADAQNQARLKLEDAGIKMQNLAMK